MFFKLSTLATLFCTAALVSQSVVGRGIPYRYRRSTPVYRRALQVETLDGSPLDPLIVDFLDQFEYMKNEADNAVAGTSSYSSILSEFSAVSSTLSSFMSGYATFVTTTATSTAVPTPQPTSTEGDGTEDLPEEDGGEGGETETEPKPTVVPTPTPTVAPPVTTSSKDGPVIITVVPQTNTAIVIIASDGTTNTITRTATAAKGKETVTVTKNVSSEEAVPRSVTTSVRPGQTAIAANSEAGDVPKNDARGMVGRASQGLWLVPAGMVLMRVF